MKIRIHKTIDSPIPNGESSIIKIHAFVLEIEDIYKYANELLKIISDTSWIKSLGTTTEKIYSATVERTTSELIKIFKEVDNKITKEFGEYMVSLSSQEALSSKLDYASLPLSEFWKEKILNNHGFDFHVISRSDFLLFGEAKYNKSDNPYSQAAKQILSFINDRKDYHDISHLTHIAPQKSVKNATEGKRGFIVSFSINSDDTDKILMNAIEARDVISLITHSQELIIIGVKN